MKYCSHCSGTIVKAIPDGDDRHRFVCIKCKKIHYQNPQIIVGIVPTYDHRILLCKRAIAPRFGFWTLPAGFMENGESTKDGAIRECYEECLAKLKEVRLFAIFDIPRINQVYLFYRAQLTEPSYSATAESSEVDLFDAHSIPWGELAFPVMTIALRRFLSDRSARNFRVHQETID
ncbi:MAG: NUDIX hydrolase [Porticoccaceae bacterium]|nr:NUDIX hydrolase [Porticoccaceae bacterium]